MTDECRLERWASHLRGAGPASAHIAGPARISLGVQLHGHGWRWPGMLTPPTPRGRMVVAPAELDRARTLALAAWRFHDPRSALPNRPDLS